MSVMFPLQNINLQRDITGGIHTFSSDYIQKVNWTDLYRSDSSYFVRWQILKILIRDKISMLTLGCLFA